MDDEIIEQTRMDMDAVIEIVQGDLATVKTGRAKPSLVEKVQVEAYDTRMPLVELATISAPDPHLLVIQPWDESIIENIAKAVNRSDLNLNANIDGGLIRIPIPLLTEERREELVKLVSQKLESGRVLLRQTRQETKKKIENSKGDPGVSEDDVYGMLDELEKLSDEYHKKIDELGKLKEEELRTI